MPQKCRICELPNRVIKKIELAFVEGQTMTKIASDFDVNYKSLYYHINNHLNQKLVRANDDILKEDGMDILNRVQRMFDRVEMIFHRNFARKKDGLALKALREERGTLTLLAQILQAGFQNKQAELEGKQREMGLEPLSLERLTKREKELYFQLNMKLLGQQETINIDNYCDFNDIVGSSDENYSKTRERNGSRKTMENPDRSSGNTEMDDIWESSDYDIDSESGINAGNNGNSEGEVEVTRRTVRKLQRTKYKNSSKDLASGQNGSRPTGFKYLKE